MLLVAEKSPAKTRPHPPQLRRCRAGAAPGRSQAEAKKAGG